MHGNNSPEKLSTQSVRRLPYYLKVLKDLQVQDVQFVSAKYIADLLGFYEVQVRKDLASVSSRPGKPRIGFNVEQLKNDIEFFLGYDHADIAALIGAGHLGQALLSYNGFADYGLEIAAAFDSDNEKTGKKIHGFEIYPMESLADICREKKILIGIITTPAHNAQNAADLLVEAGIKAIWNFAHVKLRVPENVIVQNEDMAVSFALLSNKLAQALRNTQQNKA